MKLILKKFALLGLLLTAVFTVVACTPEDTSEQMTLLNSASAAIIIDGSDSIEGDFELPGTVGGATVTWSANNTTVIVIPTTTNTEGFYEVVVNRPQIADGGVDTTVVLTATLTYEGVSITATRTVRVKAEEPSETYTSFALLYAEAAVNDSVEVQGIVYAKYAYGYFILDSTGVSLNIYTTVANTALVENGDLVTAKGTYSYYNSLFQVKELSSQVIESSDNAYTTTPIVLTDPTDLIDIDSTIKAEHGKIYTVTVTPTLVASGAYFNLWLYDGTTPVARVYYNSNAAAIDALEAMAGKLVTVDVIYYCWYSGKEVLVVFDGGAADITEVILTETEKQTADMNNISVMLAAYSEGTATLAATGAYGSTITWSVISGGATITAGVVTYPTIAAGADAVNVVLEATITRTGLTDATKQFTVVVSPIDPITVGDVMDLVQALGTAEPTIDGEAVLMQGTVLGFKWKYGYALYQGMYVTDGTDVIFVYGDIGLTDYAVGDVVMLSGTYCTYFYLPEFKTITFQAIVEDATADEYTPLELTIAEICDYTNITTPYYNQQITVTGTLVLGTGDSSSWIIDGEGNKLVFSYLVADYTDTDLEALNGMQVTFTGFLNDYHSSYGWRITGANAVFEAAPLSGQEALDADHASLLIPLEALSETTYTLPLIGGYDSEIAWTVVSGGATITAGVVTYPAVAEGADPVNVVLEATLTLDELTPLTKQFTVVVNPINPITVSEAMDLIHELGTAQNSITGEIVIVEGTILGFKWHKDMDKYQGLYLTDGTNVVYVHYTTAIGAFAIGDCVNIRGTYCTYYYLPELTSVTFMEIDDAATPADFTPVELTIAEIYDYTNITVPYYSQQITVTGTLVIGTKDSESWIIDEEGNKLVFSYLVPNYTTTELLALNGKEVIATVFLNDYHSTLGWRISGANATFVRTAEQLVIDDIAELLALVNISVTGGDTQILPTVGTNGTTVIWTEASAYASIVDGTITYSEVATATEVVLTGEFGFLVGGEAARTYRTITVTISTWEQKLTADLAEIVDLEADEFDVVNLPILGTNGSTIAWAFTAETVNDDATLADNVLTLKYKGEEYVIYLTATLTAGILEPVTKDIVVNVATLIIDDIYNANHKTADVWDDPDGTVVTYRGFVTGFYYDDGTFIQDAAGNGMLCYGIYAGLAIGDEIIVTGTLKEYKSVRELDPVTLNGIISSGNELLYMTIDTTYLASLVPTYYEVAGTLTKISGLVVDHYSGTYIYVNWATVGETPYYLSFKFPTWWADVYEAGDTLPEISFVFYNIYSVTTYNLWNVVSPAMTDEQQIAYDSALLPETTEIAPLELTADYTLPVPKYTLFDAVAPVLSAGLETYITGYAAGIFTVVLPDAADVTGTITITITADGSTTQEFVIYVKVKMLPETDKIALVYADLVEQYEGMVYDVGYTLVLPTTGEFGATILWTSSNDDVFNDETGICGTVVDPTGVVLTAAITVGLTTENHTINISVAELVETLEYETGFESADGFTAGTVYNNTSVAFTGPVGYQWGTYYGTPSTTGFITGAQSMQMRYYTAASSNYGYTYTNFDVVNVTKVVFTAKDNANVADVKVSYSTDGGATWTDAATIELTTTATEYTVDINAYGDVMIKFTMVNTTVAERLTIDTVKIYNLQ